MSVGRERVFFYGTLMRGQANHRVLVEVGATFMGEAVTVDAWTLVDLGPYPALLRAGARAVRVAGELFEIEQSSLAVLDAFEGCPDLYTRERIAVDVGSERVDAWTYVLATSPPAGAVVITSGRYRRRALARLRQG